MKLVIEVKGGCLWSVYGSPMPEGYVLDVILRDLDNIEAGDEDPCPEIGENTVYYW